MTNIVTNFSTYTNYNFTCNGSTSSAVVFNPIPTQSSNLPISVQIPCSKPAPVKRTRRHSAYTYSFKVLNGTIVTDETMLANTRNELLKNWKATPQVKGVIIKESIKRIKV